MDQIIKSVDILVQYGEVTEHSHSVVKMTPLPQFNSASKRPLYSVHERTISSVRKYFTEKNWLLLPTPATINTMYLCPKIEFEEKVSNHFTQTNAYKLIKDCSDTSQSDLQEFFHRMLRTIDLELYNLFDRYRLTLKQYRQMTSGFERDENPIHSMVFLPDTRREIVQFRPLIVNPSSSLTYITRYLYQLLQTAYSLATRDSTFNNGFEVVEALEKFSQKGLLKPNTQFFTYEINDFDMMFDHEEVIVGLKFFLSQHLSDQSTTTVTKLDVSHKTIVKLVRLVLRTQYFVYDKKLYRQTKGGNPDSSLTRLLVDIYLFYWQHDLMQFLRRHKQLFGRCYNQIFLTWKGTKTEFHSYFRRIKSDLPDLPIQLTSLGKSVHYLDIEIHHTNGILRTKVYRPSLIERYVLPYLVTYPLDQYATRIRRHLTHTIRLCDNIHDFYDEHSFIYSIYTLNGFSWHFIADCVDKFFHEFNPSKLYHQYNQETYASLRQCVRNRARVSNVCSIDNKRPFQEDLAMGTSGKRMKTS